MNAGRRFPSSFPSSFGSSFLESSSVTPFLGRAHSGHVTFLATIKALSLAFIFFYLAGGKLREANAGSFFEVNSIDIHSIWISLLLLPTVVSCCSVFGSFPIIGVDPIIGKAEFGSVAPGFLISGGTFEEDVNFDIIWATVRI